VSPLLENGLTLISGICWSIVYLDLINRGFKDKTYGMPFFALTFNLAWECIFAFVATAGGAFTLQRIVNIVWFCLDVVIGYTYVRYGRREFSKSVDQKWFAPWSALALVASFVVIYSTTLEFGDLWGARYTAFAQNLMMSVLFITMLVRRNSVEGQSMTIAVLKWLGTFAPTILVYLQTGSRLILALGLIIFAYDVIYIVLLHRKFREFGIEPFTRRPAGPISRHAPTIG
jgi:hypothetical protein